MTDLETRYRDPAGREIQPTVTWLVNGSVGHWSHIRERPDQYQADLEIRPEDGKWKLTGIESLLEERL